ncbi:putative HNH nuclease [Bacillus phage BCP78]|uniref:Putative HNH nuclease n=3 Tax=Tsarbombavirus BCP78 TaxID=1985182 RepID=J9PRY1_9CAUD|nr:putative HNH nuclease [Bacillus phage BCP78]YP_009783462.1 putative HNH nuclease [Bacillus phage BCU4]AQN32476.1 putative HNH nuclease [Bacillus phage BCP12]AXU41199.1 putative HNH nuclease [Bacillus phage BC01]AEW47106.1 putative HNH nuclease [Bacillus phage BCP78]AEW47595.1 putative HNH nuclease [Bacillus phage BCU4]
MAITYEEVRQAFTDRGYTLLATEYKNARTKMEYKCSKHPQDRQHVTWDKFKNRGQGCKYCAIDARRDKYKLPFETVKKAFEDKGYILLEDNYINNSTHMRYICPKHPDKEQKIVYNSLKQGNGCKFCGIESGVKNRVAQGHPWSARGEKHYRWNDKLTDEDREANKSRHGLPGYMPWIRSVFKKDNYTCQKCNARGVGLEAHHKDGWSWCEERRFDVTNGATLCIECHKDFHDKYGYGDNTEQQYKEWVK